MTAFFKFRCDGCDTPLISTIRTAKLSINVPRMTIIKPCPVCRKTPIEALGVSMLRMITASWFASAIMMHMAGQ